MSIYNIINMCDNNGESRHNVISTFYCTLPDSYLDNIVCLSLAVSVWTLLDAFISFGKLL